MMEYTSWEIVYMRMIFILVHSTLRGGAPAQMAVAVYSVVFVGYAVLRIRRAAVDRRKEESGRVGDAVQNPA